MIGIHTNTIGGIHIHKLFHLPTNSRVDHPFKDAESAVQKIMNKRTILHAILTVDVIFLDEAGQISAEQVATIDIIMRKLRKSLSDGSHTDSTNLSTAISSIVFGPYLLPHGPIE